MSSTRIKKLTQEQEAKLSITRERWRGVGLDTTPLDRIKVTRAINNLYQAVGYSQPTVVFVKSPLQLTTAPVLLSQLGDQLGSQLMDQLRVQVWDQLRGQLGDQLGVQLRDQLRDQFRNQLGDQLRGQLGVQLRDQLCDQLRGQLWDQLRGQLMDQLWGQLKDQLWGQLKDQLVRQLGDQLWSLLRDQFRDQLGDQLVRQLRDQLWSLLRDQFRDQFWCQLGGQLESYWVSYFSFAHRVIGCAGLDKIEVWEEVCRECGWFSAYQKVCFVSEKPQFVSFDENRRLHADGVQAVRYSDGFGVYSWRGMRWQGKAIEKYGAVRSSEWRSEWLLSEKNAEYRRALIQGIGYERIAKELEAEKRDAWREYELLKIQKEVDVEPIQLLSMKCPSTNHRHIIRVPPDMQSAREAAAWINHGIDPEKFVWEA